MIETLPWPQVLLGLAAALSILIIYDIAYVWPLCRRLAAANERCRVLEQGMGAAAQLSERIADVENRSREHWSQLGERLGQLELMTDARSYEQAIGFAEQGEQAERLMSCFGLTEGEADLVKLLHGDKDRNERERRNGTS
jgi:superfamily II DNA/RNA helicase